MDDVPWLYVAMIFIAFVSWVWNRIQEAAEYRRARRIEKEQKARARRTTSTAPEFESPYRRQEQSAPPEPVESVPKSFREVFAELERQFSEPEVEEPKPRRASPPPLPEEAVVADQSILSAKPVPVAPPLESVKLSKNRETAKALLKTFRSSKDLRTALVMKEILDKPVALRRR